MRPMALQRGARRAPALLGWVLAVAAAATFARADTGGPPSRPQADAFDALYERSRPFEASLRTIRARFTESTTSSLLVQPLVAEGTLVVRRPHDVILRYTKPEARVLRLDGSSLVFAWPDRQIREQRDIREAQARVQRYFVGRTPDELRKHFDMTTVEDTGPPAVWRIDMTPKRAQIRKGLEHLELRVRQDTLMLASMRMTFAGGDAKTMTFTDVVVNPPVSESDFEVR